jgi:hypothetical protein
MWDMLFTGLFFLVPIILALSSILKWRNNKTPLYLIVVVLCVLDSIEAFINPLYSLGGMLLPAIIYLLAGVLGDTLKKVLLFFILLIVFTFFFLLGFFAVAVFFSPKQPVAQTYQTNYAVFTIQAHANLIEEATNVQIPILGPLEVHTFSGSNGKATYGVSYSDFPHDFIENSDPHAILLSARDGAVKNINGKLLGGEKTITLDGYPGIEDTIYAQTEDGQSIIIKLRLYFAVNRLYQVMIIAPEGELTVKEMDDYLNSFNIIKE